MQAKTTNIIKRIVDVVLTVLLLFIMAFQVTGDVLHEWLGIGMTVVLIVHHILNRRWYKAVFKGKYSPYRIVMTAVNTLLLLSIALTVVSGMSMSGHAVPFILMGVHIGLHVKAMTAKLSDRGRLIFKAVLTAFAGAGLWQFIKSGIVNYITFRSHFAFLDYTTAKWLIILQNLAMLMFWVLAGNTLGELTQKNKDKKYSPKPLIWLICAVVIGAALNFALGDKSAESGAAWQAVQYVNAWAAE